MAWFFVEFSSRLTGGWRVLRLAVSEFCSSAGNLFTILYENTKRTGVRYGRLKGKGLVLRTILIEPPELVSCAPGGS